MHFFRDIQFLQRGRGIVLLFKDKEYYKQAVYTRGHTLWRCANYAKIKCVGSLKISLAEEKILHYKPHNVNCAPNANKVILKNVITACVEEAIRAEDTVPAVFKKVVSSFEDKGIHLVSNLPSFQQVKSTVYRQRNKQYEHVKIHSRTAQEIEIPSVFSDFLIGDYNDNDGRILIFSTKEAMMLLKDIKTILLDGTFKVCPVPFKKLYTLHGDLGSSEENTNIIPLVYALVTNKTKDTYIKILEIIKSNMPTFSPTEIITDFEKAAIAAIREVFPSARHHGCYFHFTRALKNKAKKLQLTENIFLDRIVSLCTVLPMLPESMIDEGWAYVLSETVSENNENLQRFLKYIDTFWLKNDLRKTWCCFGMKHRTTNSVESWHHTFRGYFKRTPPSLLIFLKKLKDDAVFQKIQAQKIMHGPRNNIRKREKKNINIDRYIQENQILLILKEISVEIFLNKMIYLKHH